MIKPKRCLLVKGVTHNIGSKKVLNIPNQFGHKIGYKKAEELEKGLATTISDQKQTTPDEVQLEGGLPTDLAFDNYYPNTETHFVPGTLHDTDPGISYQTQKS